MRKILVLLSVFLLIACNDGSGNSFDAAEVSECIKETLVLSNTAENPDDSEIPDEDTAYDGSEEPTYTSSISIIEQSSDFISFYYSSYAFDCEGYEYGYEANVDESDETLLKISVTEHDLLPDLENNCICLKKMTVEYQSTEKDLTKISKVSVVFRDKEKTLDF